MESLALLVACLFLIVSISGPVAVILAHFHLWILAAVFGFTAAITGFHWFLTVKTDIRYLGLLSALLGLGSIGFILGRVF